MPWQGAGNHAGARKLASSVRQRHLKTNQSKGRNRKHSFLICGGNRGGRTLISVNTLLRPWVAVRRAGGHTETKSKEWKLKAQATFMSEKVTVNQDRMRQSRSPHINKGNNPLRSYNACEYACIQPCCTQFHKTLDTKGQVGLDRSR